MREAREPREGGEQGEVSATVTHGRGRKRVSRAGGAMVALAGLACVALLQVPPAAEAAWRIGLLLPLQGPRSYLASEIRNGVTVALETLNGRGGVRGRSVEVVPVDAGAGRAQVLRELETFVADDRVVAVLGDVRAEAIQGIKFRVEAAGVPLLTGAWDVALTEKSKWIFRIAAGDIVARTWMPFFVGRYLEPASLAILHSTDGASSRVADAIAKVVVENWAMPPPLRLRWKPGETTFHAHLARLKAAKVASVVALTPDPEEAGNLLHQISAAGLQPRILGSGAFVTPHALALAGDAAGRLMAFTDYFPQLPDSWSQPWYAPVVPDARRQAWARQYRARFGADPSAAAVAYHDAVLLIAEAMRRAGPRRDDIRRGLEATRDFPGAMTEYSFDWAHGSVRRVYLVEMREGKPALVETVRLEFGDPC